MEQIRLKLQETILKTPTKTTMNTLLPDMDDEPRTLSTEYPDDEQSTEMDPSPISKEAERILYPPTRDEQIVNMALILLLNALTIHFPIPSHWTPHGKAFIVEFLKSSFEARVDGYLGEGKSEDPLAIIEVKSSIRTDHSNKVRMQEVAQMVGWIFNSRNSMTSQSSRR
ncbi:hypothetical protein F5884DRAFT_785402 [Xylogone sp. PMI_703]|nr:hypothetical protein F5884DRAFT_785402 [Xylogone sp. PMI_703]